MTEDEQLLLFEEMIKEIKVSENIKFSFFGVSHLTPTHVVMTVDILYRPATGGESRLGWITLDGDHILLYASMLTNRKDTMAYSLGDPECFDKISKEIADEEYYWPYYAKK